MTNTWEELQRQYWDKMAGKFKKSSVPFSARFEVQEFLRFLNSPNEAKILEIGCGTGRWTLPLLRSGLKVWATEISQESLNQVKKLAVKEKLIKNLVLKKTNFEKPKYKNQFDVVLFLGVIHHLDPKKKGKIFKNAVLALKKGGVMTALEPNPLNPFYYPLYFWRWLSNQKAKNRWSTEKGFLENRADSLKKLFKENGLGEIVIKRFAFLPTRFSDHWRPVLTINKTLLSLPLINNFSAFIWMKGEKV